jgi:tetratricopeptide (TPR) repeat protein
MLMNFFNQLGTLQDLAFWGSWASIAGMTGVLYNARRLFKISRHIDREHEKIVDTIKPFDLYFKIQEAIQVLPKQGFYGSPSDEDRSNGQKILEGLNASTECLRLYFREVHGLVIQRDNIFLDVAHSYLSKNNSERALEYYKKALSRAKDCEEEDDRIECLYGLRSCFALQGNYFACAVIDRELRRVHSQSERIDIPDQARGAFTMVSIKTKVVLRKFLRPGKMGPDKPLPGTWPVLHGELRDLIEPSGDEGLATTRQPEGLHEKQIL